MQNTSADEMKRRRALLQYWGAFVDYREQTNVLDMVLCSCLGWEDTCRHHGHGEHPESTPIISID